ncbi:MAG: hypothetical protein AAF493_17295 [Pseudomonadota bacterium]
MSWITNVLGRPAKAEVWSAVAEEYGGALIGRGFLRGHELRVTMHDYLVVLDTYSTGTNATNTYTRLALNTTTPPRFTFSVHRESIFSTVGKWFGAQDIHVGGEDFDDRYIIQGDDVSRVRELLRDPAVRTRIRSEPEINLDVRVLADGSSELIYERFGVIRDAARLRNLFDLFDAIIPTIYGAPRTRRPANGSVSCSSLE